MSLGSLAPSLAVLFAQETAAPLPPDRWLAMAKHPVGWGVVLAALAMWLMLPRGGKKGRWIGALLGVIALGCFATQMLKSSDWSGEVVFRILAAVTVVSAVCTVTFRSPVYCAVWFALTLVGTRGHFHAARSPVFGRGDDRCLRRGDSGHVFVRADARPAARKCFLRPRKLGSAAWPPAPGR